ncbi:addiction module protein [Desulfobulbus alkaliphilus]|uniref:addiction module protein n=1 Tax=Desulfobulbus alkaliphilus TaxID=869814 RepID=UPI001963278E|nr:addiction module protein [Desulfobulbus alkaliphilus]MBM9538808.1 addiction module protein [Desulfobulbus alkaliphilus]
MDTNLADEIKLLSISQRLLLAQDIWDSIAMEGDRLPMPEWQKHVLGRRYVHYEQDKTELHDWQNVHHQLRGEYK